jgi:Spc24 subunit of Ndc80
MGRREARIEYCFIICNLSPYDHLDSNSALLEGAAKLLDATADIRSMTEAGEHARRVKASREQHLQKVQKDLRGSSCYRTRPVLPHSSSPSPVVALSRTLEEAKLASQRPPTAPSESDHIRAMEALDQARYASAKTIMENDTRTQAKEADIKRLKEEITEWEQKDPMDEHELDSVALRGRILKEMGFDVKSDAAGIVENVIIRERAFFSESAYSSQLTIHSPGGESGDIRVLPVSGNADPHEQAKQLWEINSS